MVLSEVLHAHIPILGEHSSVQDAVDKMDVYQFPALVITDDNRKPIAVVTEGDLCRAITSTGQLRHLANHSIMEFATQGPTTSGPETEISDALHDMLSRGLTILPVVRDDILLGVVLRVDLMQAILMDSVPSSV
jgi:CBS domain-containing protein